MPARLLGRAAAPGADSTSTRFEGAVTGINGNTWSINDFTVIVTESTAKLEQRAPAQVGAWVEVSGTRYDSYIVATVIEVLRPAGSPAPSYQYTGTLEKQGGTFWFVGETHILVTDSTKKDPPDMAPGSLVRATVRRVEKEWLADSIVELARDAYRVPYAIEGKIVQIVDTAWLVDDVWVIVPPGLSIPVEQGDVVEVEAVEQDGRLVAQRVRLVNTSLQALVKGYVQGVPDPSADNQTWSLIVFEGNETKTETVRVTPETYVDEDRTVVSPGIEAQVEGERTGDTTVNAGMIRLDQPLPASASGALVSGGAKAVWLVGQERVWFGSPQLRRQAVAAAAMAPDAADQRGASGGNVSVHGVRLSNGVLVAQAVSAADSGPDAAPALSAAGAILSADGWFGPNFVTPAAADATKPTILFDSHGGGHAVYERDGIIYYSHQPPGRTWSQPRKIGTGWTPSAVLDARGLVHVAYRGEFMKNYDIEHVRQLPAGGWSLPVVVAPTTGASADPALAADREGKVYVAWMDLTSGSWSVQLGTWDGGYWTTYPVYYGQGQSPALTVMPSGAVFLAWQDRVAQAGNTWGNYKIFVAERLGKEQFSTLPVIVSDARGQRPDSNSIGVHVTATPEGLVHLVWVDDKTQIRYLFGHIGYWPEPYNLGPARTLVRGVGLDRGSDGLLYVAVDEGTAVSVTAAWPQTAQWPDAVVIANRSAPSGPVSDVSVSSSPDRVAVIWVDTSGAAKAGVYESRHQTARQMLRLYIPTMINP